MRPRQALVRQVAYYGTSLALAALVPTLVRALSRSLWPAPRVPRKNGRGASADGKGVLVAAVVGAAVGAGVALLLAPASGNQFPERLARRTRDLEDGAGIAFERRKDVISNGEIPSP